MGGVIMERRFLYALVRCVPDPRTGEFVNYGAIAGDPESGEWSTRQVSNTERVRSFATAKDLDAVKAFFTRVEYEIDAALQLFDDEFRAPEFLREDWLSQLHHDHRNIVQLSRPAPIIANSAEQALDLIFGDQVIDPVHEARVQGITKNTIAARIRRSLAAHIGARWVERPIVHVGEHLHTPVDFAAGNGRIVQLSQGWSFQIGKAEDVPQKVKAWAYAIEKLRSGKTGHIRHNDGHESIIERDVDLEVVVAQPMDHQHRDALAEAEQVFADVGANVRDIEQADAVGQRAAQLLDEGDVGS